MARGLDILEMMPSEHLSANEIAAAKLVMLDEFNPQSQPKIVWPAAFPVVRLPRSAGARQRPRGRTHHRDRHGARCGRGEERRRARHRAPYPGHRGGQGCGGSE